MADLDSFIDSMRELKNEYIAKYGDDWDSHSHGKEMEAELISEYGYDEYNRLLREAEREL